MTSIQPLAPRALSGKVAIVTGSTSGIGLAIAKALAAQGCAIVMNGFGDPAKIENNRADISATYFVPVIYDGADMSKPSQIRKLVKRTVKELGGVDIVVNNAGIQHVTPIDKMPLKKWHQVIAINLTAAFVMTAAALPHMRKKKWGRIINISSAHGKVASPGKAPYCSSKHGLLGLTKVTALDAAEDGITANAICPGWVDTDIFQAQVKARAEREGILYVEAAKLIVGEKQAIKRPSSVESIGAAAVYLCSDAAETMTGADLVIDCGWCAE